MHTFSSTLRFSTGENLFPRVIISKMLPYVNLAFHLQDEVRFIGATAVCILFYSIEFKRPIITGCPDIASLTLCPKSWQVP